MIEFCNKSAGLVQFIGYLLLIFKVVIPVVIIVLGAIDFGKAVVADKDDEIKKSAKTLLIRAISGVCIFFIPNIVLWIFSLINGYNDQQKAATFSTCQTCLLNPMSDVCKSAVEKTGEY